MLGRNARKQRTHRTNQEIPGGPVDYTAVEPFALYKLFKSGDEKAFEALYHRYSAGLFNYCLRLTGDWHHAEDVMVETFTKLAASNLQDTGSLKAWLYRVATNSCYRSFRKKRTEQRFSEVSFLGSTEDPGPHMIREFEIQKLVQGLPENQRTVIILKFYDDLTYQEIADILCCPLGTVKSRLHEGIQNLRRRINGLQKH